MALELGWLDTYQVLIVPFLAGVFGVFMLRQYFLTLLASSRTRRGSTARTPSESFAT